MTLVMTAAVMTALMLILGLCIEAGNVLYRRTVMRDATDAAARAGAFEVGKGHDAALRAAHQVLLENASVNKVDGTGASVGLEYGTWSLENRTFAPTYGDKSDADAVRVTANIPVEPIFVSKRTMKTSTMTSSAIARRATLVLVVRDPNNLGANDAEMLRRMKKWGVPTQVLSAGKVEASLFTTEDVVMISSTALSSVLRGKLANAECAVICCEVNNWQELGFGSNYGTTFRSKLSSPDANTDYMNVRDLPETFGFAGRRKIYDGQGAFGWGKPRGEVTKVATWAGDSTKTLAFYYEKGKRLDNGKIAAGFRAGLFMRTGEDYADQWTYSTYTWDCFDAMFAKCLPYVDRKVYLVE